MAHLSARSYPSVSHLHFNDFESSGSLGQIWAVTGKGSVRFQPNASRLYALSTLRPPRHRARFPLLETPPIFPYHAPEVTTARRRVANRHTAMADQDSSAGRLFSGCVFTFVESKDLSAKLRQEVRHLRSSRAPVRLARQHVGLTRCKAVGQRHQVRWRGSPGEARWLPPPQRGDSHCRQHH